MGIKSQLSSAYTPTLNGCSEGKIGVKKWTLIKMIESWVITSVNDNLELLRGLCRLMMTPKVGGLKGSFTIFLFSVRTHILDSNEVWYS